MAAGAGVEVADEELEPDESSEDQPSGVLREPTRLKRLLGVLFEPLGVLGFGLLMLTESRNGSNGRKAEAW